MANSIGHWVGILWLTGRARRAAPGWLVLCTIVLLAWSAPGLHAQSFINLANGQVFNTTPVTITGQTQGARLIEFQLNGGDWTWVQGDPTWSQSLNLNLGANTISLRVYQGVGQPPQLVGPINFTYEIPSVSILTPDNFGTVNASDITITLSQTIPSNDPVVTTALRVNGGEWITFDGAPTSIPATPPPGYDTFEVRTRTRAGLNSNIALDHTFQEAGANLPTISFDVTQDPIQITTFPYALTGKAVAAYPEGPPIDFIEIQVDGGPIVHANGTTNWSIPLSLDQINGVHTVSARAHDGTNRYSQIITTHLDDHLLQQTSLRGTLQLASPATAIAVQGTTAFVASSGVALQVVDISNLDHPQLIGTYTSPQSSSVFQHDQVQWIRLNGTRAYLGNGTAFQAIDISQTTQPMLLAELALPGNSQDALILDNRAVILGGPSPSDSRVTNVYTVDITSPPNFTLTNTFSDLGAYHAFVQTSLATYLARQSPTGIQALNLNNPGQISGSTFFETEQNADLGYQYLVYGAAGNHIAIWDVAYWHAGPYAFNSTYPFSTVTGLSSPNNGLLWVTDATTGLMVFDVDGSVDPMLRGITGIPAGGVIGSANDVACSVVNQTFAVAQYVGAFSQRPVVVSLPTAATRWTPGSDVVIDWQTDYNRAGDAVDLTLLRDGASVTDLGFDWSFIDSGEATVTLPANLPASANYQVRATSLWNPALQALSPAFTIGN